MNFVMENVAKPSAALLLLLTFQRCSQEMTTKEATKTSLQITYPAAIQRNLYDPKKHQNFVTKVVGYRVVRAIVRTVDRYIPYHEEPS